MRILYPFCIAWALLHMQAPSAAPPSDLDDLLEQVRESAQQSTAQEEQRVQKFLAQRDAQRALLAEARTKLASREQQAEQLEALFHARQAQLSEARARLEDRLGALQAVLSQVQEVAGDTAVRIRQSVTSAEVPGRDAFALELSERAADGAELPSVQDIRTLWFSLQQEMTLAAQVSRFSAPMTAADGSTSQREVVRVGTFNLVDAAGYLAYRPETQRVVAPARQPDLLITLKAKAFHAATEGFPVLPIDPARGEILALIGKVPDALERIEQGGVIGLIILALGALALLIAGERGWVLMRIDRAIRRQLGAREIRSDNALGRILAVHASAPDQGLERLESRLGEATLRELPPLTRFLPSLRLIAAVAPLLGLLGTIVGMIQTFQSLTLFGTGDPRLMAGGISQALVTTMLGLSVAVPTLLLHALVSSRSRNIVHLLEEQTAGLIARRTQETRDTQ